MKIEPIQNIMTAEHAVREVAVSKVDAVARNTSSMIKDTPVDEKRTDQEDAEFASNIKKNVEEMNTQLETMNRSIKFNVDDESADLVVKIVDKESGEIIRQIPPEGVLKLREHLEDMTGLVVEEEV